MQEYICIKELDMPLYDEHLDYPKGTFTIKAGTKYTVEETTHRSVGGRDTIRLLGIDEDWIELLPETLNEHFKLSGE